ncbi:hypothetical protein AWB68_08215 [Caballeronia choica]|uniref:Uncharacterized protein n=1 Tax=Caballeronia choica TaxID=326476 RepID=A0A158L1W8_9BURK|nr:hypothetical protein AWB68_08215 [Caballeronia choica]
MKNALKYPRFIPLTRQEQSAVFFISARETEGGT